VSDSQQIVELAGFDPLSGNFENDILEQAQRRHIIGILSSYNSYFDIFSELFQNALDALDQRRASDSSFGGDTKKAEIKLTINLQESSVAVVDNGVGLSLQMLKLFLSPNVSFGKEKGRTRGYKGVVATYLAYGFGIMQIHTKHKGSEGLFEKAIKLENGRAWAQDDSGSRSRPTFEEIGLFANELSTQESGTAIKIFLSRSKNENPKDLAHFGTTSAKKWADLLRIKTPIGCVNISTPPYEPHLSVKLIQHDGTVSEENDVKCDYFWPEQEIGTNYKVQDAVDIDKALTKVKGQVTKLPQKFKLLDCIYRDWNLNELLDPNGDFKALTNEERTLIRDHDVHVRAVWFHSAKLWTHLNDNIIGLRKGSSVIRGGVQIANDRMPQGDTSEIPLTSSIGYQRNCHVVVHFDRADPDQGRKSFQADIKSIAETISTRVVGLLKDYRSFLKKDTGALTLSNRAALQQWMAEQRDHRRDNPMPKSGGLEHVKMSSFPLQEQDVITPLHQFVGLDILRGYEFFGTFSNERYDGLATLNYADLPRDQIVYDMNQNWLGVEEGFKSVRDYDFVLEYKYDLDAIFRDIEQQIKSAAQMSLVVCWEIGNRSPDGDIDINSLLTDNNGRNREYFGSTHEVVINGQREFEVICLADIVRRLA
jgi:hypothetical protein